ncbi:uncharacterized protein BYT42DRAFT_518980 [Radiomyces spectabilis]|uniref:uncharacterized protein n=1 Tax=Radiomyces spectabilis TaxID=64574 RepID=UPI002220F4D1|nr:uncharacterized protein BYT42DRAFT_518980 [Radiomyces spectabilis]KAI8372869.1 hypothetical protein BYT42DRAFT_518980 [Radiomyces spectabilis]
MMAELVQEQKPNSTTTAVNDGQSSTASTTPVRKRTRATADQLAVLEDTFAVNVSPNSKLRKQLSEKLQMSERSIQIWFQNRRAKVKHMQKRAQMQMHQASIRAQMYYYQQQQQQHQHPRPHSHQQQRQYFQHLSATVPPPPPPQSKLPLMPCNPYSMLYTNTASHMAISRAQSVDAIQPVPNVYVTPPPGVWPTPSTMMRQSMPPHQLKDVHLDFPAYIHGPMSPSPSPHPNTMTVTPSTIPTLVSVPDAGPTAMLTTQTSVSTPPPGTVMWPTASAVQPSNSAPASTIDPSNLMMTPPSNDNDLHLSVTTLTIGTWHRLKMSNSDLLCLFNPAQRVLAWHVVDSGCHFKIEIALDAVVSIQYTACDVLGEVHIDLSESPQFFMQSQEDPSTDSQWIQCSDFTEGKQASHLYRHTVQGLAHQIKQELTAWTTHHEEMRLLVHFVESEPDSTFADPSSSITTTLMLPTGDMSYSSPSHPSFLPSSHISAVSCSFSPAPPSLSSIPTETLTYVDPANLSYSTTSDLPSTLSSCDYLYSASNKQCHTQSELMPLAN